MKYEKTARLIRKKRKEKKLTQSDLAKVVFVTPQAVSLWEQGERFPDAAAQVMLYKILNLNPVELLTGLEMFDDTLKKGIAAHMDRMGEEPFVAGMVTDEYGNESYLDLSNYVIASMTNDTDKWISYAEYHNIEPAPKYENPYALPLSAYDPGKIYINSNHSIFVIPVEILVLMGKPLYFNILWDPEKCCAGFRFSDNPDYNEFDIPENVYNGKWKGLRINGGEFGKMLCKEMDIRNTLDLTEIEPVFIPGDRAVILELDRAKRVNVEIDSPAYLLPKWQYNGILEKDEDYASQ